MAKTKKSINKNRLQEYFKTNLKDAKNYLSRVQKSPTENSIYRLRVAIRRVRTVLMILDDNGIKTLSSKEEKRVTKLWKTLGRQRDLDVAIGNAKKYKVDTTKLMKLKKEVTKKASKVLNDKDLLKILKALKKVCDGLTKKEVVLIKTIAKFQSELDQKFKTLEEVHEFRILFKKIRYALDSVGVSIEDFKPMQNVLGHLNDLDCLNELLGGSPKIKKLRDRQYKIGLKKIPAAKKLALRKLKMYQV